MRGQKPEFQTTGEFAMSRGSRRAFLQQSAAIGIGVGLSAGLSGRVFGANDKIHVACIGVRGRGNSVMHSFADEPDCVVTHICDVNESVRHQRGEEMKQKTGIAPNLVNDFRTLLDDKSIDAFMVATPDHWHALLTIHGCLAGKDVYVEKPASHNVIEGKTAVAAARKHDRMVQMGTQLRSATYLREAAEYVRSGALGKVIFGRAWETDRSSEVRLAPNGLPPAELDYDIWQGPVAERPFNSSIVGGAWRWLFDYGTGDLGNDGVHRLDVAAWALSAAGEAVGDPPLALPNTVSTGGGKWYFDDMQEWPDTLQVTYEYPGFIATYENRLGNAQSMFQQNYGILFHGSKGTMFVDRGRYRGAASRAYYAMFSAARALLLARGVANADAKVQASVDYYSVDGETGNGAVELPS
jgi:predicted dehydrogenase